MARLGAQRQERRWTQSRVQRRMLDLHGSDWMSSMGTADGVTETSNRPTPPGHMLPQNAYGLLDRHCAVNAVHGHEVDRVDAQLHQGLVDALAHIGCVAVAAPGPSTGLALWPGRLWGACTDWRRDSGTEVFASRPMYRPSPGAC